jgi:hypothetical protein
VGVTSPSGRAEIENDRDVERRVAELVAPIEEACSGGHGLVGLAHRAGDRYARRPADFFMSHASVELLATDAKCGTLPDRGPA